MKICPITYESFEGEGDYSLKGLRQLSAQLTHLKRLPLTAQNQRQEAIARASKMAVQGMQLKLSAILKPKDKCFELVNQSGKFILKPPAIEYLELPENEDLTMRLAAIVGIETPMHGLIYAQDGSLTYFISRFDRLAKNQKVPLEDFAQLLNYDRDTKYESSMENVAKVIEKFCTFPVVEKVKLFERTLFNFLIGNEDMHLKNFSLITRNGRRELAPAYDFLSSTIALVHTKEELALPIRGKKSRLNYADFFDYFARERLNINSQTLEKIRDRFNAAFSPWEAFIHRSFLSRSTKEKYLDLIRARRKRMKL